MPSIFVFTVFQSNGQQTKPADSGYVSVNGIKVYYEGCPFTGACQPDDADENDIRLSGWVFEVI
jgi:hypothetical protein